MLQHEILEILRARPFQAFRIFVSDGATYVIRHPDLVLVTPTAAVVGAPMGDQPGPAVEGFRIVDLAHITRMEHLETPSSESASS